MCVNDLSAKETDKKTHINAYTTNKRLRFAIKCECRFVCGCLGIL